MTPRDQHITPFGRKFFNAEQYFTYIGGGSLGGKAKGLEFINHILSQEFDSRAFSQIKVTIPTMTVICTDVFEAFMERNQLRETALSDLPDDRIAHAFQKADLPAEVVGDLWALMQQVHSPLAIRSSSRLEDALYEPFAGIYATKMIPNNQHDPAARFRKLNEAIKFVYASTFFKSARGYFQASRHRIEDEKMAVIIQEVVGQRHGKRFYPELSGVARSYNFYSMGHAQPQDGVASLALGLGKTIVDGGITWTYSPAYPRHDPPFSSPGEMLKQSQTEFWAINMGRAPAYDPLHETEYLTRGSLMDAESDDTLRYTASTFDMHSGKLSIGSWAKGPRILTFSPLLHLNEIPLNEVIKTLLKLCQETLETPVEMEFAMTFNPHRFGFLQVRPMVVSTERVDLREEELSGRNVLLASDKVLGNGIVSDIQDIVFVMPERFEAKHSGKIAAELEKFNRRLLSDNRRYLLMGFGRWGSSDPWLGIPVNWGQIGGAKVIVESTLSNMNVDLSQGSHFFHNLTSFRVSYFSVKHSGIFQIDWEWLNRQPIVEQGEFVRHSRLSQPLQIKVDGRCGRGVIYKSVK